MAQLARSLWALALSLRSCDDLRLLATTYTVISDIHTHTYAPNLSRHTCTCCVFSLLFLTILVHTLTYYLQLFIRCRVIGVAAAALNTTRQQNVLIARSSLRLHERLDEACTDLTERHDVLGCLW